MSLVASFPFLWLDFSLFMAKSTRVLVPTQSVAVAAAPLSWPLFKTSLPIVEFSDVGNSTRATY